jgi:hypothetical protein
MWLYECDINLNKKLSREDEGLVKIPCIKEELLIQSLLVCLGMLWVAYN